jgi:NADPH:quinone reductase-like Zn-dependent oxidoreductase
MKAIVHSRYGAPDVLELKDIDQPVVDDDDVLVRVHAAAVGKGDWLTVGGLPYVARMRYGLPKPKHPVPGFDVAGRIEAAGSDVTKLQPGDEVFGWCDGSFAEYASVPQSQLALKPANLRFEQAAAGPISGFAALQALRDTGGVQPGQTVVIIGASGGVGSFAVQLAKAYGAEVTGVCSTKSLDMVRSLGADHVIDHTQQDFTRSGQRYDLILEMAGTAPWPISAARSPPRGRWCSSEGRAARCLWGPVAPSERWWCRCSWPAAALVLFQATGSGPGCPEGARRSRQAHPGDRPNVPVERETAEAIRYVGEQSTQGKTVITV